MPGLRSFWLRVLGFGASVARAGRADRSAWCDPDGSDRQPAPMRKTLLPQMGQVPLIAGLPFFIVMF